MDLVDVERLGGFAGFGGPGGHLKSKGTVDLETLPQAERDRIHELLKNPPAPAPSRPDAFRYRLTHHTRSGTKTIEVPETHIPKALSSAVNDTID